MKDKELLLEAIDDYPKFRPLRKTILKLIVGCSVNGVSIIAPRALFDKLKISKSTAYLHLKALKKDGIIISPEEGEERFTTFRLNQIRADDIVAAYSTKKDHFQKTQT